MKNRDTISCHQTGVIAGFMLLVLKLTSLPSLMYDAHEIGGVVTIILICLFNILVLALIVWLKRKYENKNLYEIFSSFLGHAITKIIYLILFLFFLFKLMSLVDDGFGFVRDIADEEFKYSSFIICFFPVICALAYSGIRNLARTCEFFYPFVLIGLFVAIVFSFAPINFWGIGSISRLNINLVGSVLSRLSFWNGDLFAMIIFLDKIELKKGRVRQVFSPIIIVSIFLVMAYAMYYSLYQQTAILHTNMIFDIIQYYVGTSSGWHMDIFAIIIYMVCLYLQGAIYLYSSGVALGRVFYFYNFKITYTGIVITIVTIQYLYLNDYLKYVVFAQRYLSVASVVLLILIPILMFFFALAKRRKNARDLA